MIKLQNETLLRTQSYINGAWISAKSGQTFEVTNPYDQSVIAQVADLGRAETKEAIAHTKEALKIWQEKTAYQRNKILCQWHDLIIKNTDDLAKIITCEQGKPIAESKSEILYGASFIEWFAQEARRIYGDTIPSHHPNKRTIVLKQPIGVVAAITPWNFPSAMITRKVAPALAAGCTVIIKPSELTPLSALALAVLAEEAGLPKGVFNVITGQSADTIGQELTTNPMVRKFSFTGSTAVGKKLAQQCASSIKKVSLELGGNAPFIVMDDANIDQAVWGALVSKYRNTGQTCICTNRIYVQDAVYEEFVYKFTQKVQTLKMGDGLDPNVNIGTLINTYAFKKAERLVQDAIQKGGKITTGGKPHALGGNFYEPTVIANATTDMDITHEESFAPIAPIYAFQNDDKVIHSANDTSYGLACYFYGQNMSRIWRMAEALEYGMVGINTTSISSAVAPFGGIKQSGIGREGSKYGIDDFVELKYVCFEV